MTREQKLALIIGFSLVLLVGVLISDHLSGAQQATLEDVGPLAERTQRDPMVDTPLPEQIAASDGLTAPARSPAREPSGAERSAPSEVASNDGGVSDALRRLQDAFRSEGVEAAVQTDTSPLPTADPLAGRRAERRPQSTPLREADRAEAAREPAVKRYRIEKGDTLWSIAQAQYGDGHLAPRLATFNIERDHLRDASTLRVGATLLLPEPDALGAPDAESPVASADRGSTPSRPKTYTVKKGDTLSEIAQGQMGSARHMQRLLDANKDRIDDADDIWVGLELVIPSS